jgi:hypothetical protein
MRDIFVQAAGALAIAAALVHGYLGETKVFPAAHIEPGWAGRLMRSLYRCTVLDWSALGALLILAPTMGSGPARHAIIAASAVIFAIAAAGNAWSTRGRHFGWGVMLLVVGLALAGF